MLICFRLLGRYPLLGELTELIKVSQATICRYFNVFCRVYSEVIYPEVVKVPQSDEEVHSSMYRVCGLARLNLIRRLCICGVGCCSVEYAQSFE